MMRRLDSGCNLEESQVRIDWLDDRWRGIENRFLTGANGRKKFQMRWEKLYMKQVF